MPSLSQLDESNITDKSLSDISDSEKSQWRQWSPTYFDHFVGFADLYLKGTKASFTDNKCS